MFFRDLANLLFHFKNIVYTDIGILFVYSPIDQTYYRYTNRVPSVAVLDDIVLFYRVIKKKNISSVVYLSTLIDTLRLKTFSRNARRNIELKNVASMYKNAKLRT